MKYIDRYDLMPKIFIFEQIAWINKDTATVLSYNDVLITRNPRISVKKEEGEENIQNWKLAIKNVMKKDEGFYQCQLNTEKTKAMNVYLEVTSMQLYIL